MAEVVPSRELSSMFCTIKVRASSTKCRAPSVSLTGCHSLYRPTYPRCLVATFLLFVRACLKHSSQLIAVLIMYGSPVNSDSSRNEIAWSKRVGRIRNPAWWRCRRSDCRETAAHQASRFHRIWTNWSRRNLPLSDSMCTSRVRHATYGRTAKLFADYEICQWIVLELTPQTSSFATAESVQRAAPTVSRGL